ncbi:MAG TPA: hypothetical protein VF809_03160 [Candidatus Saccharimonadales bacterium]
MAYISLYDETKELERQAGSILSAFDVNELPQRERELVTVLKNQLADARLDARDYEYAQTRVEQLGAVKEARAHLATLQETIVKASEYNLFGAVDVAQLSARIQQIISRLE